MTADEVISALGLPQAAYVDRRVPKSLLLEHGAPTAADRRRIRDGIDQIQWVATLKPTTIGVAAFQDNAREYLEIAVLRLALRPSAKISRLVELLHRAVPYPVFAVTALASLVHLSVAHKRWSQGEADKTVLDGDIVAVECPRDGEQAAVPFLAALELSRQPQESLYALYQGWMDTLLALAAARRTNAFHVPTTVEQRVVRREALQECERLEAEISRLRKAAAKEKQLARQVELNFELKRAEVALAAALSRLRGQK